MLLQLYNPFVPVNKIYKLDHVLFQSTVGSHTRKYFYVVRLYIYVTLLVYIMLRRTPIYMYIYNNKSGKTVSKELNENSEH